MIVAGIDEAGRGPCFGPMTLAIVVMEKDQEKELKSIGVKDSKDILLNKRNLLFNEIKPFIKDHQIIVVDNLEINDLMVNESLNEIEAIKVAELINKCKTEFDVIYIDSPDSVKGRFEKRIRKYLNKDKQKIKIIAENKADSKYIVVGAASIMAKVTRDNEVKKLREEYGDFGSGYPSDPKTKKFLEEYFNRNKELPPFSRVFWSTCKKYVNAGDRKQTKLF
jgi:ribonuclease HII